MTIVLTWHGFLNADDLLNFCIFHSAVDSQHQCGSSDNARQMLSMDKSKRDTSPQLHKRQYIGDCHNLWELNFRFLVCDSWNFLNYVCLFFQEFEHHLMALFSLSYFFSRWLSIVPFVGFVCSFWSGVSAMSYYFSGII